MRGTIHFVPAEDAKWMVQLLMPRVVSRIQSIYRKAGLDEAVFTRARSLIENALQGGKRLTRDALYELLEAGGIETPNMSGLHILGRLASDAVICFGPRKGKQPTFVLLDEWIPTSRKLAGDEALAELARRYFTSHGPATLQDFVWWTGLTVADAKAGLEAVKSLLTEETIGGITYWWGEGVASASVQSPALHLLPAYDEYLVSYKDRSASFDLQNAPVMSESQRHLSSIIVIDGQVVGNWKRTFRKGKVVIDATCARSLTSAEQAEFEAAAQRYGDFLGMQAVIGQQTLI